MADDTLSWQSTFWAIIPIALNTMYQPSARILGFPSRLNFMLRCSPITCALSAIDSLARLAIYTYREKTLIGGLRHWIDIRFSDSTATSDGSFLSLRKNTIFRITLFLLGTLPQYIKICAATGVIITKTWCTMFISTLIVDEIILLFARQNVSSGADEDRKRPFKDVADIHLWGFPLYHLFTRICFCASDIFISGFLVHGLSVFSRQAFGHIRLVLILVFTILAVVWTSILVLSHLIASQSRVWIRLALIWFAIPTTLFIISAVISASDAMAVIRSDGLLFTLLCGLSTAVCIGIIQHTISRTPESYPVYIEPSLAILNFSFHVLATGLYYGLAYDPPTTTKPLWTEWLG